MVNSITQREFSQEKRLQNVLTKLGAAIIIMVYTKCKQEGRVETLNAEEIGKKLRSLRGEKAQGIVANALGISRSALSMYESGQRIPRDEIKIRFARYYDKSVEYIFFDY